MQAVKKDFLSLSLQELHKLQPIYKVARVWESGYELNPPFEASWGWGGAGRGRHASSLQSTKAL